MQKRFKKVVALIAIALLVATGLTALMAAEPEAKSEAAVASQFDPGLIISDSVFYDFGTMTVSEIQRFLNAKASTRCVENILGPKCLKDFRMDTQAVTGESGRCASMPARADQTAAQIIYYVARACGINPRVLIVTLQKEQGLIQAWNPSQRMYDFALGMSCPDTPSGCSKADAGFFWQLYKGAGQLQWYGDPRGSFTYLRVGTDIKRDYQANKSSCGYRTFRLKSQATAALYYYTPYTPNQPALDNLYGEGDTCSAYGNRNFWRFYTDWFGSTIGGGFLLKSKTSGTYLTVENKKYLITDQAAIEAFSALGPVGEVSDSYLESFSDSGPVGRLIKNNSTTPTYYFVDGSKRYTFTNVAQVQEFGFDPASAVRLTSSQLTALPGAGTMTEYISGTDGTKYLVEDGKKRQILDVASISSTPLPALSKVKIQAFSALPWGAPIARAGVVFETVETGKSMISDGTTIFEISPAVKADLPIANWFSATTAKMHEAAIATVLSAASLKPIFADSAGRQYVLTNAGKRPVQAGAVLIQDAPVLSQALIDRIPNGTSTLFPSITFAKASNSTNVYLVRGGKKRLLPTSADRNLFSGLIPNTRVETIRPSVMSMFTESGTVFEPGAVIKTSDTKETFFIDTLTRAVKIPSTSQAALLGLESPLAVPLKQLRSYNRSDSYNRLKIQCGAQIYLTIGGRLYPIGSSEASEFPTSPLLLGEQSCATLNRSTVSVGTYIRTLNPSTYWQVQDGKRTKVPVETYKSRPVGTPAAVIVGPYFASKLKILGVPEVATSTSLASPEASSYYQVRAGDSFSTIAGRFGLTLSALKELNPQVADINRVSVGQLLKIRG
jgi:LysM repeat protein